MVVSSLPVVSPLLSVVWGVVGWLVGVSPLPPLFFFVEVSPFFGGGLPDGNGNFFAVLVRYLLTVFVDLIGHGFALFVLFIDHIYFFAVFIDLCAKLGVCIGQTGLGGIGGRVLSVCLLEEQAAKTPQTSTLSAMINAILFFKGNTLLLVLCTVISPTL